MIMALNKLAIPNLFSRPPRLDMIDTKPLARDFQNLGIHLPRLAPLAHLLKQMRDILHHVDRKLVIISSYLA